MPRHHDAALPAPGVAPRRLQVFTPPHIPSSHEPRIVAATVAGEAARRADSAPGTSGSLRGATHGGSDPSNPLTAEHTTANAWEEPSTRLSVLARAGPRGRPASDVARSSRSACTATRMAGDYLRVYERLIEHKAERASKA